MPVADVPSAPLAGTSKLLARQYSSDHVIGLVHWSFSFGPVGPLKKPRCFSPHRPSKPSQGYARR